jgi:hypothetical protein
VTLGWLLDLLGGVVLSTAVRRPRRAMGPELHWGPPAWLLGALGGALEAAVGLALGLVLAALGGTPRSALLRRNQLGRHWGSLLWTLGALEGALEPSVGRTLGMLGVLGGAPRMAVLGGAPRSAVLGGAPRLAFRSWMWWESRCSPWPLGELEGALEHPVGRPVGWLLGALGRAPRLAALGQMPRLAIWGKTWLERR